MGLIAILWGFTFLLSLTSAVSNFEYDLFLYIVGLQPPDRELVAIPSVQPAPQWILLLVYGLVLAVYVRRYTRSRRCYAL